MYRERLIIDDSQDCPSELTAFSDQISEIQYFSSHPSSRFFDLLRIEAIREHFRNYTNLTGELPLRSLVSSCNEAYGHSINNIYELGASGFNPDVKNRETDSSLIANRNRTMIHQLFSLSQNKKHYLK